MPLVLLLDATTARVHWEMVAQTSPTAPGLDVSRNDLAEDVDRLFLGTGAA